jgi:hypothetical protein
MTRPPLFVALVFGGSPFIYRGISFGGLYIGAHIRVGGLLSSERLGLLFKSASFKFLIQRQICERNRLSRLNFRRFRGVKMEEKTTVDFGPPYPAVMVSSLHNQLVITRHTTNGGQSTGGNKNSQCRGNSQFVVAALSAGTYSAEERNFICARRRDHWRALQRR